jgi:hypothetical protein
MQHPPFVGLALHLQVGQKIKILTHNEGVQGPPVKILRPIDKPVLTHGLVLQHNVIRIQEDQVYVTKAMARQVGEDIQPPLPNPAMTRHNRQIQVTSGARTVSSARTEQVHRLDAWVFWEHIG